MASKSMAAQLAVSVCDRPFGLIVEHARALHWTRDPFDRVIVAQALAVDAHLVTADTNIRDHVALAVW